MSTPNLWGEIPSQTDVRAPVVILREQASKLSEVTNMVLVGQVNVARENNYIELNLEIVAPSLDHYTYRVLEASHQVLMYPVKVTDVNHALPDEEPYVITCTNETEFTDTVARILSSKKIHSVIASLIAQARAF